MNQAHSERYTYCKYSSAHGFGVFAKEDLAPGTIWWYADSDSTLEFNRDVHRHIQSASRQHTAWKLLLEAIGKYAYYDPKKDALILCLCNARYTNHSDTPNCVMLPGDPAHSQITLAIQKGAEIFENYREYGCCTWAEECSDFLFNKQISTGVSASVNGFMEPGPAYIILSKTQVDIYMQSHLEAPISKALLTCLNEYGSLDDGVWKITIPDCNVEP